MSAQEKESLNAKLMQIIMFVFLDSFLFHWMVLYSRLIQMNSWKYLRVCADIYWTDFPLLLRILLWNCAYMYHTIIHVLMCAFIHIFFSFPSPLPSVMFPSSFSIFLFSSYLFHSLMLNLPISALFLNVYVQLLRRQWKWVVRWPAKLQ